MQWPNRVKRQAEKSTAKLRMVKIVVSLKEGNDK
jgi:hypothetical protein